MSDWFVKRAEENEKTISQNKISEVVPDTLEDFQTLSINQKKKKKSKLYEIAYIRTSF